MMDEQSKPKYVEQLTTEQYREKYRTSLTDDYVGPCFAGAVIFGPAILIAAIFVASLIGFLLQITANQ